MLCDLLGAEIGASPHRFYSLLCAHLHVGKEGEGGGGGEDTVASGSYRGLRDALWKPGHQRASLLSTQRKKKTAVGRRRRRRRAAYSRVPRRLATLPHRISQRSVKKNSSGEEEEEEEEEE